MATVAVSALADEDEFQRPALFPWIARRGMLGQETENPVEAVLGRLRVRHFQIPRGDFAEPQVLSSVGRRDHAHRKTEIDVRIRQQRFQRHRGLDHGPLIQMVLEVRADLEREPLTIPIAYLPGY